MTAATTYEIGTTLGTMATLASIGAINPESQFTDYPDSIKLADGTTRARGFPTASWHYGYLTPTQYNALRAFVTLASAEIFIATLNNNREFVRYTGVMVMPDTFVLRNTAGSDNRLGYVDVTIEFNRLVEAE